MKPFLDQLRDDILALLFNNVLTKTTLIGLTGFYVQLKHPEFLVQYTTMVHTWLVAKEG